MDMLALVPSTSSFGDGIFLFLSAAEELTVSSILGECLYAAYDFCRKLPGFHDAFGAAFWRHFQCAPIVRFTFEGRGGTVGAIEKG